MLPKEKRLRSERDFKRVYQKGSFFSLRFFNVNYIPNKLGLTRLAFVVNKKAAKKAVVRNTLKRAFREVFRSLYSNIPAGYDIVINIRPEAIGAKQPEIAAEAKKFIEKLSRR